VNGFNSDDQTIHIQIPGDIADKIGLEKGTAYIARDLIWREMEVGFDDKWRFELRMKPYSSFIFKIK
jgi:hypothetical protein